MERKVKRFAPVLGPAKRPMDFYGRPYLGLAEKVLFLVL
jgi:hypothetical protein